MGGWTESKVVPWAYKAHREEGIYVCNLAKFKPRLKIVSNYIYCYSAKAANVTKNSTILLLA